jgi:UDP-N-acetylglucosamine 1-carboxyvinyltransferase
MDKFVIEGGAELKGTVATSGSKNAALPIMVAALLVSGKTTLRHVPQLRDVGTLSRLLEMMGARIERQGDALLIDTRDLVSVEAPYDLVKTMRASIYVLGPLLARARRARVSLPGGCAWGPRPVDLHLKGMEALGAKITIDEGYVVAECPRGLVGAEILLDIASVGATGNILMAAVGAKGRTVIRNAAREPEIPALAAALVAMGARIEGAGTSEITIDGNHPLRSTVVDNIPDRIEAGTFLVGAAMTHGDVTVTRCASGHLNALLSKLKEAGADVTAEGDWVRVRGPERPRAVNVTTDFYPGFPTDLQAQMMAMASLAEGTSIITEQIYRDRFTHVAELNRLGAGITLDGNVAVIEGRQELSGAHVMATDLRASAALILAGLAARGETHISRVYHIDRGYEHIEAKLADLGAVVRREQEALVV